MPATPAIRRTIPGPSTPEILPRPTTPGRSTIPMPPGRRVETRKAPAARKAIKAQRIAPDPVVLAVAVEAPDPVPAAVLVRAAQARAVLPAGAAAAPAAKGSSQLKREARREARNSRAPASFRCPGRPSPRKTPGSHREQIHPTHAPSPSITNSLIWNPIPSSVLLSML